MILALLGTAAGGGCPQWNCACDMCRLARSDHGAVSPRLHACVAVSVSRKRWYLINATPDVRLQIEAYPPLNPGPGMRQTPLTGVLLTCAELDSTTGLLILREGASFNVYATHPVLTALDHAFPIRRMLESYADIAWHEVVPGRSFLLDDGKLSVVAIAVGSKRPCYASTLDSQGAWVCGYYLEDRLTGKTALIVPTIETTSEELLSAMSQADCVLADGTFWRDTELIDAASGKLTATAMGHIPLSGRHGLVELLSTARGRKILLHINNTNPIQMESAPERDYLLYRGIEVGHDGLEVVL